MSKGGEGEGEEMKRGDEKDTRKRWRRKQWTSTE
jgi:hypothetical protein